MHPDDATGVRRRSANRGDRERRRVRGKDRLARDELLEATRNREAGPFDRTIDVQVGRLRRKIEADPQRPELIKSVRGAGYVLTCKVERS